MNSSMLNALWDDGHVRRRMSAVVDDADGGRLAFCLDFLGVLDVVRSGR